MYQYPPLDSDIIRNVAQFLTPTESGLKGSEICDVLNDLNIEDISPNETKWKRVFYALVNAQKKTRSGQALVGFIQAALHPRRYINKEDEFNRKRKELNKVLAFSEMTVNEKGLVEPAGKITTLAEVGARFGDLIEELKRRGTHEEVLKYCSTEVLSKNYFHATLEATKSVAQRIRSLTGLSNDGAKLIDKAFGGEPPLLKINSFSSETDQSEHRGFSLLLKGLFGFVRNPIAHSPKIDRDMPEVDFLDWMTLLSLIHRTLDRATRADETHSS